MLTTRRTLMLFALGASTVARAAPGGLPTNVGHGDTSPRWDALRPKLFGARPLAVGDASAVQLSAPLRAAYGASVPIKIVARQPNTPGRYIKHITLLVDNNPSPIAARLTLSPVSPKADFETRLRVDEYSHVRVIAEMNTGELSTDSRYVKTSGGCSAPPNRDKLHLIGKTQFRLPQAPVPGAPSVAEVSVVHPNDTGFELNNVTVMYIPPHFVRTLRVTLDDQPLFESEQDFSISENPSWRFVYPAPAQGGVLRAEVTDSKDGRFEGLLALKDAPVSAAGDS